MAEYEEVHRRHCGVRLGKRVRMLRLTGRWSPVDGRKSSPVVRQSVVGRRSSVVRRPSFVVVVFFAVGRRRSSMASHRCQPSLR